MLRRFETYRLRQGVPEATRARFEAILRGCGRFIPQLLDSIAARNLSDAPVDLVWEHAYESPESYEAYLRHPYHICVLDRYLLPDAPQRIIEYDGSGLGLAGYEIDAPGYRRGAGLRRLLLLRVREASTRRELDALLAFLRDAPRQAPELALSIAAENRMGAEWFPGVWTHLWEQAFDSEEALTAYLAGPSAAARAEREGWRRGPGAAVERAVGVHYRLDAPREAQAR